MKLKRMLAALVAITAILGISGCNLVVDDGGQSSDSGFITPNQSTPDESSDNNSAADSSSNPADSSGSESSTTDSSEEIPKYEVPDDGGEMSGTVLILNNTNRGIVLFGGGKQGGKDYAETVSKIKAEVGGNVKFYSMVAPTSGSFYLPDNLKSKMASEPDNIDNINDNLVGVTPVDAYTALLKHVNEDIYFRTDHHWTQLGAYYAAEEFAKVAGVPFAQLSEYEKFEREGYIGSLYGYSGENAKLRKNPDTFTFYKPKNKFTVSVYDPKYEYQYDMSFKFTENSTYMIYGTDTQINYVKTDCTNGRKLVIIGDSYDNALYLNLTNSFEEIWVCDMRSVTSSYTYFDLNIVDFIKKMGATDVLFNMDTFSAVGGNRNGLKIMLNSKNMLP